MQVFRVNEGLYIIDIFLFELKNLTSCLLLKSALRDHVDRW